MTGFRNRIGGGVVRASLFCLLLLGSFPASALETASWPAWNAAAPAAFPGTEWQRYATPEEAGWSSEGLAVARALALENKSAAGFVLFNGAVLTEWGETVRRFKCHSVRKSLLSALYGIAVEEGHIDPAATLAGIGLDDTTPLTETEKSAKISDLLKARSGIYLPAAYETRRMRRDKPERGSHAPGTFWYYNNWDFNALGAIYNRQTGSDLFGDFETRIARPLQMQDFDLSHTYYHLEAGRSRFPAYPFRMSARDLARFGLLFLNEGRWKGEEIVPAAWVEESTRDYSPRKNGGGYGYMWWTFGRRLGELGAYAALGYGGQAVIVVPGANLVYVNRADTYDRLHMATKTIVEVLLQILHARTGPPKGVPELLALEAPEGPRPEAVLSGAERARLTGAYRNRHIEARVSDTGDGLVIADPAQGTFRLLPRSATEFLIEDFQRRLVFTEGDDGGIAALELERAGGGWSVAPRTGD